MSYLVVRKEAFHLLVDVLHGMSISLSSLHAKVDKMTARSDAMQKALDRLTSAVNTEAENFKSAVDAAIAAHQNDDDAAFDAATQRANNIADALANHATVATNAAQSAPPDTAAGGTTAQQAANR